MNWADFLNAHCNKFFLDCYPTLWLLNVEGPLKLYLLEKHFKEIYPEELELKKESRSSTKVLFIDVEQDIKDNVISSKLYYKLDSFHLNEVDK